MPPQERAVLELVERAQRGEATALLLLLEKYQPLLHSLTTRFRRHLAPSALLIEADDLRQEAAKNFIELVQQFDARRGSSFGAYLKAKLPWRMANFLRAERRRVAGQCPFNGSSPNRLAEEMPAARPEVTLSPFQAEVENPRLRAALRQLSPRQRSVIARFYWQEKTVREIAQGDGISPQAVTALRRRAEAILRQSLTSRRP